MLFQKMNSMPPQRPPTEHTRMLARLAYARNRKHCCAVKKAWREANQEKVKQISKRRYQKDPEKRRRASRKFHWEHREDQLRKMAAYREANRDLIADRIRKWRQDPNRKAERAAKFRERRKVDLSFRIETNLRTRIHGAMLRKAKKAEKLQTLLGCSILEFRQHLESQFLAGMHWNNYGTVWEVDHIVPCKAFDFTKESHQRFCFHYSNHRPLWVLDNQRKNGRITKEQMELVSTL